MNKLGAFFVLSVGLLFSDICSDLAKDLRGIFEKNAIIQGRFSRVIPFPNQGGSFINQIFLVESDLGEEFALKIENAKWEREKTLNEVKGIEFMSKHTSIPVPKIVAYKAALSQSTLGSEYILMKRLPGKPFNHEFARIYADKKAFAYSGAAR